MRKAGKVACCHSPTTGQPRASRRCQCESAAPLVDLIRKEKKIVSCRAAKCWQCTEGYQFAVPIFGMSFACTNVPCVKVRAVTSTDVGPAPFSLNACTMNLK